MPETEPKVTVQVALIDTWVYLESCQTSKMIWEEAFRKNSYSLDPKDIKMFERDLKIVELLNIRGFWISTKLQIYLGSEYARVHNILNFLGGFFF